MRTSPGPHPSRSPKTSKYMYNPAACRSPGRVKVRHLSKRSFDVADFFLPVTTLLDARIVFSSNHIFCKSYSALLPSSVRSGSSKRCPPESRTFHTGRNPTCVHYEPAWRKKPPPARLPDTLRRLL